MTTQDPKPARRIPDEGLFTISFLNVGRQKATFVVQVQSPTEDEIDHAIRQHTHISTKHLTFYMPYETHPGIIYARNKRIGTFTVTPPTLKGDADEPT